MKKIAIIIVIAVSSLPFASCEKKINYSKVKTSTADSTGTNNTANNQGAQAAGG